MSLVQIVSTEMSFVAGKVALVTGGACGIGLAIVKAILKDEAKGVAIVDFNKETGTSVVADLQHEFGDKLMFVQADVTKEQELEDAFIKTVTRFKTLDIVVNSAGIYDEKNWDRMIAINLVGTMRSTRLAMETFLPKYKSSEKGVIVNIASLAGLTSEPFMVGYFTSKHGVVGLGRCLSEDPIFNDKNINVLTLCPGAVDTSLWKDVLMDNEFNFPLLSPEYIGTSLLTLLNSGKRGIWVLEFDEPPYRAEFPSTLATHVGKL